MLGASFGVGHDRGRVLRPVADVAILIRGVLPVFVGQIEIELVAEIGPGNVLAGQFVADRAERRRRHGEDGIVRVLVGVGVGAVAEIARVVVVDQIVMSRFAIRGDFVRIEKFPARGDARLRGIGAVDIAAAAVVRFGRHSGGAARTAAVAVLNVEVVRAGLRVRIFDFRQCGRATRQRRGGAGRIDAIVRRRGGIAPDAAEPDRVPGAQHHVVGRKNLIERTIFADNDNNMLDRPIPFDKRFETVSPWRAG